MFQRRLAAGYAAHPDLGSVPIDEARRIAAAVRAPFAEGGPVMARTVEHIATHGGVSVPVRVHIPPATSTPLAALVYLHGGGWRYFSVDTHDRLMREYAARAGIAVVGIEYALAPEAPYPAALRQTSATLDWLQRDAAALGIDATRLAIGGDSAGANLALAAALQLDASGRPSALRALVLNYGTFRRDTDSASHRLFCGPRYSLTSEEMVGFWRDYLGPAHATADDASAEPLRATSRALRGLPPCYLAVAECDVLRDDSVALAALLAQADVDVTTVVYPGTTHSFLEAMSIAAVSRRALDETAAWLRAHLSVDRASAP